MYSYPAARCLAALRPHRSGARPGTVLALPRSSRRRPPSRQVVLSEDVKGLGRAGDLVAVKPAYAQNFLVSKGLGQVATPDMLKKIAQEVRARPLNSRHPARVVALAVPDLAPSRALCVNVDRVGLTPSSGATRALDRAASGGG